MDSHYRGLIRRYRDRLPVPDGARVISLNEGDTPLIELENLPRVAGVDARILVKFEGLNPTGSFKDRGMTMAVTHAVAEGTKAVICASTGNTSASAAAYAARAGIAAFVLIPEGKIAQGKLAQAMMHGATVLQINGNFDDGMRIVKEIVHEAPISLVNSVNPYRLQGQKTAAFEICDALGRAPDYHCIPVGNAGNISAYWTGYSEYAGVNDPCTAACKYCEGHCEFVTGKVVDSRPVMAGYQAAGAAPFLKGEMVDAPETVATAIRIGHPQSWDLAWAAVNESGGWFDLFEDDDILAMQKMLAEHEGVFCEPASAVSVAGAVRDLKSGRIPAGSLVTCTVTGHGLKDPDTAISQSSRVQQVEPTLDAVKAAILEQLD